MSISGPSNDNKANKNWDKIGADGRRHIMSFLSPETQAKIESVSKGFKEMGGDLKAWEQLAKTHSVYVPAGSNAKLEYKKTIQINAAILRCLPEQLLKEVIDSPNPFVKRESISKLISYYAIALIDDGGDGDSLIKALNKSFENFFQNEKKSLGFVENLYLFLSNNIATDKIEVWKEFFSLGGFEVCPNSIQTFCMASIPAAKKIEILQSLIPTSLTFIGPKSTEQQQIKLLMTGVLSLETEHFKKIASEVINYAVNDYLTNFVQYQPSGKKHIPIKLPFLRLISLFADQALQTKILNTLIEEESKIKHSNDKKWVDEYIPRLELTKKMVESSKPAEYLAWLKLSE